MEADRRVVVLGLGYVGLPLAVGFVRAGLEVIGYDVSHDVVDRLTRGDSPVQGVTNDELQEALATSLQVSSRASELHGLDAYVICVPTPLSPEGFPDLSAVKAATQTVAGQVERGALVVLESTTYPGTTEEVVAPILESGSGLVVGTDIDLAYSPERIDPGNPTFTVMNTPKVVGGLDLRSRERAAALYGRLGIEVVRAKGLREAELAKLLENTYRQVNIAMVNEMLKFCSALGIDLYDAISCAATKPFGFEAFRPGPGVGGHCIPIDPNYLSYRVRAELGYSFRFVELAQEINASMPAFVVDAVQQALNRVGKPLQGSRVRLFGVTYKADVADTRESPATVVVRLLRQRGAEVAYVDPLVGAWEVDGMPVQCIKVDDVEQDEVDCALLLQHHRAFADIRWNRVSRCVVDAQGRLEGPNVHRLSGEAR